MTYVQCTYVHNTRTVCICAGRESSVSMYSMYVRMYVNTLCMCLHLLYIFVSTACMCVSHCVHEIYKLEVAQRKYMHAKNPHTYVHMHCVYLYVCVCVCH